MAQRSSIGSADVVMTSDGVVSVLTRTNFKLVLEAVPGVAPELMAFLSAPAAGR